MNNPNFKSYGDTMVWFIGTVTDVDDPLKLGRVRVKIFDWHDDYEGDYPWAQPIQSITSAAASDVGFSPTGMVVGSWVVGFFLDGNDAQRPAIFGTIAGIAAEEPFREERKDEPDTNRLARNDGRDDDKYDHDILAYKKTKVTDTVSSGKYKDFVGLRESDIPIALSSKTWDEPETEYNADYPKNHVFESESGHIKEFDDTPGYERIHEWHKSGTFYEVHPDGSRVNHIVGDSYNIVAYDNNVSINGDCNLYIASDCTTFIGGDWKIQVGGDKEEVIAGDYKLSVAQDLELIAAGELSGIAGKNLAMASGKDAVLAGAKSAYVAGGVTAGLGSLGKVEVRSIVSSIDLDARTSRVNLNEASPRRVWSF